MNNIRYGTSDELYELYKNKPTKKVHYEEIIPMLHAKENTKYLTHKPILVNRYTKRIIDGNHRYYDALKHNKKLIKVKLVSPYVKEVHDYNTGKNEIKISNKRFRI